ncbi:MAG: Plug domain-containing protein, partial [Gammaproteobacteria bacterium]
MRNRSLRPSFGPLSPAAAIACLLLPVENAAAQTEGDAFEGVRLFELAYYDEFDPLTALDIVNRTPGFSLDEDNGGRGLSGVRSNVLIDGRRPPPKGQSIRQLLDEMPVDGIQLIELIDAGARLDIDMQGFAQVVNVITVTDRPAYYELITEYQHSGTGEVRQQNGSRTEVEAIGTFSWQAHEFTVRGDTQYFSNESPADLVSIDPANPAQRLSSVSRFSRGDDRVELNALFAITDESSLTFNGEIRFEEMSNLPIGIDAADLTNTTVQSFDRNEDSQDFSAEYRRPIGSSGTLMLALVDADSTDESESRLSDGDSQRASRNERESGETAARIRMTQSPTDRITIRTTASSAFNFFEGGFRLFANDIEIPVQGSVNRVEEDRRSV